MKGAAVPESWVAGYVRVSTEMQVERDSLTNQEQALAAHCQAQGWNLRLYRDAGVSAKDTERAGLRELLADVRAGQVSVVLVTKLDRISRSLHDLLDLVALFEEKAVKFVSIRDNIDTGGPVGRFILHILGAIAELERGITAERVAEDMKLRAKRGKWNGGLVPYGRTLADGRHLETVPEEAELLQRMRLLLQEKRSWRGVAVTLNREGKRTRGWEAAERDGYVVRKGKPPDEWTAVSVKRVLLQRINEGTLVYNRRQSRGRTSTARPEDQHIVVEGFCDPIFSRSQMETLQQLAGELKGTPPRRTASPHLLSGLIYCGCGTRMQAVQNYVTTKRGRYPVVYYRCRRANQKGTCDTRQMAARLLEPAVVGELRSFLLAPASLRVLAKSAEIRFQDNERPLRERKKALFKELEHLVRREETLIELVEDGLVSKTEFAMRRSTLAEEHKAAQSELLTLEANLAARSSTAVDVFGASSELVSLGDVYERLEEPEERRQLLATCIARIIVRQAGAIEVEVPILAHARPLDGSAVGNL